MKRVFIRAVALAVALFLCSHAYAMDAKTFYGLAQGQKGINAFAATCQSALETGNWTSPLWRNTYNGAGLKAPPSWRASKPYVEFVSPESKDGVYFKKSSFFRKYESPQAFLKDYAVKIKQDYPHCTIDNTWGYFAGLYRGRLGKWATDHKYFEKLAKKAVQLEPTLLSQGHLKRSLSYAIEQGYLEDWQIKIIEAVMK
jgi:flagellum-specific peptidoglycan hydrolase FlgJ